MVGDRRLDAGPEPIAVLAVVCEQLGEQLSQEIISICKV